MAISHGGDMALHVQGHDVSEYPCWGVGGGKSPAVWLPRSNRWGVIASAGCWPRRLGSSSLILFMGFWWTLESVSQSVQGLGQVQDRC